MHVKRSHISTDRVEKVTAQKALQPSHYQTFHISAMFCPYLRLTFRFLAVQAFFSLHAKCASSPGLLENITTIGHSICNTYPSPPVSISECTPLFRFLGSQPDAWVKHAIHGDHMPMHFFFPKASARCEVTLAGYGGAADEFSLLEVIAVGKLVLRYLHEIVECCKY